MATSFAPVLISGGCNPNTCGLRRTKSPSLSKVTKLAVRRKSKQVGSFPDSSVRADYRDGNRGGGGGDFVTGFLLGGAICGTLAYVFAPQIRRSILNEDEYGFRRAKRPIYYDEGLEETRQTLNEKISQLNSAIDNVSSRLRGGNNSPSIPLETDPEVEAMSDL